MAQFSLSAVVLAAGSGTRMKSRRSKVLHELAGRPLLHYPVLAAAQAGAQQVIAVAGPSNVAEIEASVAALPGIACDVVVQARPLGTGDAAKAALPAVRGEHTLILYGDVPLVRASDLEALVRRFRESGAALALSSCELDEPAGYGRILRDASSGDVVAIREHRDLCGAEELGIREVNAGIYLCQSARLAAALASLGNDNAQGEYYLTDIVAALAARDRVIASPGDPSVMQGVNDRRQLAALEHVLFERIADRHRLAGVTVQVGARIDDGVSIGTDSVVQAGACLRGATRLGSGVFVDTGAVLSDAEIGDDVLVRAHTVISESRVERGAKLGPFAHLRPGSVIEAEAHVGNFVETKQTRLGPGAKANHLAYLGDGDVGAGANVGAGTIFCNYDGFSKAKTVIGEGAFIGSDSQLIAPVTIGKGAYVGTGTTVTQDVPDGALALSRVPQLNKPGYAEQLRERLARQAAAKKASKP